MSPYTVEHIGLDMAFHHPRGANLKLADAVIEAYETDKEHAEIFVQTATDTAFSPVEILNWFLMQTQTTISDHLPKNTRPSEGHPVLMTFPIRFEIGTFSLQTEAGKTDLSHLKLMCKISLNHTKH
ncbi:MAG: hypothetical protein COB59_11060 [Rhodospirillaceae bacterium]|nr:MAG: hypothetical protein COB59_11060 [Rhodospirillaceae bacterium]